jgi:hypothetical protein
MTMIVGTEKKWDACQTNKDTAKDSHNRGDCEIDDSWLRTSRNFLEEEITVVTHRKYKKFGININSSIDYVNNHTTT